MTTALVSAFYDINDVIQQSEHRPMSLNLHNNFNLSQKRNESLLSRRHSTSSANSQKIINASTFFSNMPGSPKTNQDNYNKLFAYQNAKERSVSVSGGEDSDGQQRKQRVSTNSSRYKTELCRPYEENGTCKYSDKCQFAHGYHELRSLNRHPKYKTELCRTFHTIGFCPYGPRCHFVHKAEELEKSDSRSDSVSSLGSTPPSPTPSMESLQSPFVNIPTPNTPSLDENVFVFGDETSAPISPSSSGSSGSTSPLDSPFPPPSPMLNSRAPKMPSPKSMRITGMIVQHGSSVSVPVPIPLSPGNSSGGEKSPVSSESPPSLSSDEEFDAFGRRRLPIFNKLA